MIISLNSNRLIDSKVTGFVKDITGIALESRDVQDNVYIVVLSPDETVDIIRKIISNDSLLMSALFKY